MALTFFDSQESGNSLPFLNEYLEQNPKTKGQYIVETISLVRSHKGYLCDTPSFRVFLWKNSSLTKTLLEALDHYINSGVGYEIYVVIDKKAKEGYRLAADLERETTWFGSGNGYSIRQELSDSAKASLQQNPFLPMSPS